MKIRLEDIVLTFFVLVAVLFLFYTIYYSFFASRLPYQYIDDVIIEEVINVSGPARYYPRTWTVKLVDKPGTYVVFYPGDYIGEKSEMQLYKTKYGEYVFLKGEQK